MSTVRRVFFYLLAFITLFILAIGLWNLFALVFDSIKVAFTLAEVGDVRERLSLGIAMVVIGGPLWFLFWNTMLRQAERDRDEAGTALRAFFLNSVLIVFALILLIFIPVLLSWILGGFQPDRFNPEGTAWLLVAATAWTYHWSISVKEGQTTQVAKTVRRWYVYGFSAAGLICLAVSLVRLLDAAYTSFPVWQGTLVQGVFWNRATQDELAWMITGGIFWAFFWFYSARNDTASSLRQVYFYLLTTLGGALAGLVALAITFQKVLYWLLGGDRDVANYFQFLGWSIPAFIVAFCIWYYHLAVAREESGAERRHQVMARRVHYYLMSFLGLGAMVAGLIILFGIPLDWLINTLSQGEIIESGWWYRSLSTGIALLIVSVPIWLLYWGRITGSTEDDGLNERSARSRRIYLYVIIGASVVMLAADLVNIVYQLLNGMMTGNLGLDALRNSRWSLQTILLAIPLLIYHLQIARQDQKLGADATAIHRNITVITMDKKAPVISALEHQLGYKIRAVQYVGKTANAIFSPSDSDIRQIVTQINDTASPNVIVVLLEGQTLVLPYI